MKRRFSVACLLLLLTVCAFILQGYHPGAEDDAVYLSSIKKDLQPSLYPFNAEFFTLQMQATVFDKIVATSVRVSHLPVSYVCLLWQLAAILLMLSGCWSILAFCFSTVRARLAGVLTIACLLTLSVAGTALYVSDEHLHPRSLATGTILFAVAAIQRKQPLCATFLLVLAFLLHPIMALFGVSFCLLLAIVQQVDRRRALRAPAADAHPVPVAHLAGRAAVLPGGWLFAPSTPAWRQALLQHSYYTLARWAWYEWLGALAPPFLLWLLARLGRRRGNTPLAQLSAAVCLFSVVQLAIAFFMLLPPAFHRLTPLQPMRYLHLTFILMALLAGGALGQYVLTGGLGRWLLIFLPLAGINGYAQRIRYPATQNLELPWQAPRNPWLQAFAWVRVSTPTGAVFALDPEYLDLPGEDHHSFRALAERSSLADAMKDAAVVTQVPLLAETWVAQQKQQAGWRSWTRSDFARLAQTTPVRWVLVDPAQSRDLTCPYTNQVVSVCRTP